MNKTNSDPAKPIGKVTIIPDFLPPPEQLVRKKKTAQLTPHNPPLDHQQ